MKRAGRLAIDVTRAAVWLGDDPDELRRALVGTIDATAGEVQRSASDREQVAVFDKLREEAFRSFLRSEDEYYGGPA